MIEKLFELSNIAYPDEENLGYLKSDTSIQFTENGIDKELFAAIKWEYQGFYRDVFYELEMRLVEKPSLKYKIIKFTYPNLRLYSISRLDEKKMNWDELYRVKELLNENWCCMYFPPKKDLIDNANEYHLFSCEEPNLHLCKGFEGSNPLIEELIIK